ncbi:MAG: DUF6049 family protein [Lacisediminihabitans sp.]
MRLVTLLLGLSMGIGAMAIGDGALPTSTASAPSTTTPSTGVTFTIAPAGQGIVVPGEDLVITGELSNASSTAVAAATALVYLNRAIAGSRSDLSKWLNSDVDGVDTRLGSQIFEGASPEVPPGESRPVSIVVPAAALGIGSSPSTWGARALAVRIMTGTTEVAGAHSSIVWNPGVTFQPTKLAVAVPIDLPQTTSGLISADSLANFTAPGGLLTRQLDQAVDREVAIAIDPMIIASIKILGNTAPLSATAWLTRLQAARNDTFALPYADSDISAASQAGSGAVLAPTGFAIDPKLFPVQPATPSPTAGATADATAGPTPTPPASLSTVSPSIVGIPTSATLLDWSYTLRAIAWPLSGTVVAKDLATFAHSGLTTTILSSTNSSYGTMSATPSASATIDNHSIIVSDDTISQLLQKAVFAPTDLEWQGAVAELSASLAVVTRERPGGAPTLLATLGRGYPTSSFRLAQTLAALTNIPWLATTTLSDALAVVPVAATVVDQPQNATRISQVKSLLDSEQAVGAFSSVLGNPSVLLGERRLSLLAALSNSWVSNPTGWTSAYSQYLAASTKITSSVQIAESSSVNLLSDKVNLPVTVRNDLAYPVNVVVLVRSPSGILNVVDGKVPLTVEPNSQARASVAVRSVANGDVTLSVSLTSPTGVTISNPTSVQINVQAGWETAVTVVIALLLLVVFGFGIWRNITKRRKTAIVEDADDAPPAAPMQHPATTHGVP